MTTIRPIQITLIFFEVLTGVKTVTRPPNVKEGNSFCDELHPDLGMFYAGGVTSRKEVVLFDKREGRTTGPSRDKT